MTNKEGLTRTNKEWKITTPSVLIHVGDWRGADCGERKE